MYLENDNHCWTIKPKITTPNEQDEQNFDAMIFSSVILLLRNQSIW